MLHSHTVSLGWGTSEKKQHHCACVREERGTHGQGPVDLNLPLSCTQRIKAGKLSRFLTATVGVLWVDLYKIS